ncbi:MAG: DeoR/GlpR family DNA-binding transcription regulator [Thermoactinomyces sp.]
MFAEERREKILELLQTHKRVLAKELAEIFDVSVDSIRRDLSIMEKQGLLKKTHGGAIPGSKVRRMPPSPSLRYTKEGSPHTNAIAKLAASYIEEGDTIFIGSAAIHYDMLKFLPQKMPFTVVTHSIQIAEALRDIECIDTYLIGGKVKRSGSITDALANEFVRHFSIDLSFATGGGISENGISTATPEVASFGRAINEVSRRKICLASHDKLGIDMFAKIVPIHHVDLVITDEQADQDAIQKIQDKGVKVIIAKVE